MEIMEEVSIARPVAVRLSEKEDLGDIVMQSATAPPPTVNPRTISLKMTERQSSPALSNGRLPTPVRIDSPALTLSVAPTPAPTPPPRTKSLPKAGPKPAIRPPIKPASKKAPAVPRATKAPSKTTAAALAAQSTSTASPKKRAKRDSLPDPSLPLPAPPKVDVVQPRAIVPMGRGVGPSQHHTAHPMPSSGSDESSDDDDSDDDDTGLPEGYLPPTFPPSVIGRRNTIDQDDNSESEEDFEGLANEINAGLSNGMGTGGKGRGRRKSSISSMAHMSNAVAAASKRPAAPIVRPRNGAPVPRGQGSSNFHSASIAMTDGCV